MWKTALATHEGTSIAVPADTTLFPLSYSAPHATTFTWDPYVNPGNFSQAFANSVYHNNTLPEFYAFRDGLHLRVRGPLGDSSSTVHDSFIPSPGPTLGDPTSYARADDDDKFYKRAYGGKVVAWSPGCSWNVWRNYAGIERGYGRGQREGRSILSLSSTLSLSLTPAVLDIPVTEVLDNELEGIHASGLAPGGLPYFPPGQRTAYVMPTWAQVIVFSYRNKSATFIDDDDVKADDPAHPTNTLSWIKNANTTVLHTEGGERVVQPAENYIGRRLERPSGGVGPVGNYTRPGIDDPTLGSPVTVADYNVPFIKSRPIRVPSDIWIDTNKVKVHHTRTVYFPNTPSAIRDCETTLATRWATNRQFDWEVEGSYRRTVLGGPSGDGPYTGIVGTDVPPDARFGAAISNSTPGIAVLKKDPKVWPKQVNITMRFNGARVTFDDDQDDDEPAATVVRRADLYATAPDKPLVTVTDENQSGAAAAVIEEEDDGDGEAVAHGAAIPYPSLGAAEAVVRAKSYKDNIPYNNLYFTVVTPCYKVPVGVTNSELSYDESRARWNYQIPNWGAVPVKVTAQTRFNFKR